MRINKSCKSVAIGMVVGSLGLAQVRAVPAVVNLQDEAERIVSKFKTLMDTPPRRVPSRDTVDGPLLGNGGLGAVISGAPESQRFWLGKNNFWRLRDGHRQGGPRPLGGLEINIPALTGATYNIEQQFFTALTTSRFSKDGGTVLMRSWVAAMDDILVVELVAEGKAVEVATRLWAAPGRGSKEELGRKDGVLWATKAFAGEKIPTAAAAALTVLGAQASHPELEPVVEEVFPDPPPRRAPPRKVKSQPGPKFMLQPGHKVTLVVAVQSSFDAKDPLAAVQEAARNLTAEALAKSLDKHRQWWRAFWAHSLIEISDPFLEQQYYAANYELGCALRDPEFPTGLFGLPITDDDPRWAGDYHLNFDYQSQFYGLYKSNHLEQADTFDAPVLAFMERGKDTAKEVMKIRGVYYPVGIGAKGIQTSAPGTFMGQKCNAIYCVVNMSMRWYHTYDKEYAKKVYPFVNEVANFWEDFLKFEDGRYVIYNDSIQENSGADVNSIMSLGLVRNLFETIIDMSRELGVDANRQAKWQDIVKNLSKFPTFEKDGVTVFRYSEKGTEWIDGNSCVLQHIFPSGAIGLDDDPKLLEIARNTINAKGRKWSGDNGENSHYPAAVRVGYDPAVILEKLTQLWSTSRKTTSGLPEDPEQCSTVPETLNEMLCMSHRQVLRVFAVWPKTKDARFLNLRAEGAFLVSSALKDSTVQYLKITSEKGRDCTFVNPWPGKAVDVYQDGKKILTLNGERAVLKTQAGTTSVLVAAGAALPDGV
jgi:alpha-L-fucosidase 2